MIQQASTPSLKNSNPPNLSNIDSQASTSTIIGEVSSLPVSTPAYIQRKIPIRKEGVLVPIRKGVQELGEEEKEISATVSTPIKSALPQITYETVDLAVISLKYNGVTFALIDFSSATDEDFIGLNTRLNEDSKTLDILIKVSAGVKVAERVDYEQLKAVGVENFRISTQQPPPKIRITSKDFCEESITLIIDGVSGKISKCVTDPPVKLPEEEPSLLEEFVELQKKGLEAQFEMGKGALLGDIIEDPNIWNILGQVIVGFIPYAGQAADLRDTIVSLKRIIFDGGWKSGWEWANLVLTLIGWVPGLGDAIKAGGKAFIKFLQNFFKGFGGIGPFLVKHLDELRKLGKELTTAGKQHLDQAVRFIRELAQAAGKRANELADSARKYYDEISGIISERAVALRRGVVETGKKAQQRVSKFAEQVKEKLGIKKPGPSEPKFPRAQKELDDLARDPAQGNKITIKGIHERKVILELEKRGDIPGPVRRDPTGGAEWIDADNTFWDMKSFNSKFPPSKGGYELNDALAKIERELKLGENVILDTTDLIPEHIDEIRNAVKAAGWWNRIRWY